MSDIINAFSTVSDAFSSIPKSVVDGGRTAIYSGEAAFAVKDIASDVREEGSLKDKIKGKGAPVASNLGIVTSDVGGLLKVVPHVTQVGVAAAGVLGPLGACTTLAFDSVQAMQRHKQYVQIKKEFEESSSDGPITYKHELLHAKYRYAYKMQLTSKVAVVMDTAQVVSSFVPAAGIPISCVCFVGALGRIHTEYKAGCKFKSRLEKLTSHYEKHNQDIIKHPEAFKKKGQDIFENYVKDKYAEKRAEEALNLAVRRRQQGIPGASQDVIEATELHDKAAEALDKSHAALKKYDMEKSEFDAYQESREILKKLNPALKKEEELMTLVKEYEKQHQKDLERLGGIPAMREALQAELKGLSKDKPRYEAIKKELDDLGAYEKAIKELSKSLQEKDFLTKEDLDPKLAEEERLRFIVKGYEKQYQTKLSKVGVSGMKKALEEEQSKLMPTSERYKAITSELGALDAYVKAKKRVSEEFITAEDFLTKS